MEDNNEEDITISCPASFFCYFVYELICDMKFYVDLRTFLKLSLNADEQRSFIGSILNEHDDQDRVRVENITELRNKFCLFAT